MVSAAQTVAAADGPLSCQADEACTIDILPRDAFGNAVDSGALNLTAHVTRVADPPTAEPQAAQSLAQIEDIRDGVVSVTYRSSKVGACVVRAHAREPS